MKLQLTILFLQIISSELTIYDNNKILKETNQQMNTDQICD